MDNCSVCGRRMRGDHDGLCVDCILEETDAGFAWEPSREAGWLEGDSR